MWVECGRDLEQGRQFVITALMEVVTMTEILYGPRPVDACHQSVKAQAGMLHQLRGADVKRVIDNCSRANLVDVIRQQNTGSQRDGEAYRRKCSGAQARTQVHFKFRRSKMRTAPLRAAAV